MGKPKFSLKINAPRKLRVKAKPESKAEATVYRRDIRARESQIQDAVEWCKENNK